MGSILIIHVHGRCPYTHGMMFVCCFTSYARIFPSYRDVIMANEGLQNLGLRTARVFFEQGGIFIVPHLLWYMTTGNCFIHGSPSYFISKGGPCMKQVPVHMTCTRFLRSRLKNCPIVVHSTACKMFYSSRIPTGLHRFSKCNKIDIHVLGACGSLETHFDIQKIRMK